MFAGSFTLPPEESLPEAESCIFPISLEVWVSACCEDVLDSPKSPVGDGFEVGVPFITDSVDCGCEKVGVVAESVGAGADVGLISDGAEVGFGADVGAGAD